MIINLIIHFGSIVVRLSGILNGVISRVVKVVILLIIKRTKLLIFILVVKALNGCSIVLS